MPEDIQIILVEPGAVVSEASGGARPETEIRHEVWANRRDAAGDAFVENRAVTADSVAIFRIRDWGPEGLRPTTDWWLIDKFDENRRYRIDHVARVRSRGSTRETHFDLYGSFRGRKAA